MSKQVLAATIALHVACAGTLLAAPAPSLASYSPAPVASATAQTVTLTGSRLNPNGLKIVRLINGAWQPFGTVSAATTTSLKWTAVLDVAGALTIAAQNRDGKRSNQLQVQIAAPPPLPPPVSQITLEWDPPTDGITAGYVVYWGSSATELTQQMSVGLVTTYAMTGLTPSTTTYFGLKARDAAGALSEMSNVVSGVAP